MEPPVAFRGTRRFEPIALLGEGAVGEVYAAHDRDRGTRVAVKRLRRLGPDDVQRFKHEFRSLADLHHPNLVSLGELFLEDGEWFFTMELIEGVSFLDWVRPAGRLDEARLRAALGQLAAGLSALHAAGKVHRDVKPSNVLVNAEGRVVLLDLGLVADVRSSGSSFVGTPHYRAPEQAARQPAGRAADWYAVGVMLYEALTGYRCSRPAPIDHPIVRPARRQSLTIGHYGPTGWVDGRRSGAARLRVRN
jgi:serine/threonine protein kinase